MLTHNWDFCVDSVRMYVNHFEMGQEQTKEWEMLDLKFPYQFRSHGPCGLEGVKRGCLAWGVASLC